MLKRGAGSDEMGEGETGNREMSNGETMEWWRSLRATYLTLDKRSLGLFRVAFGVVLFSDLFRRWAEVGFWYANTGLLPNHTLLWRPPTSSLFSLFFTLSSVHEADLGFLLCAGVYVMFITGYRTGFAQALTLLARVSLNSRIPVLENGGDMVINLLCLLTLPLPLGARFSLDALASKPKQLVAAEGASEAPALSAAEEPAESIAVLALILQFATIYLLNAANKSGPAWRDGTAVHWALSQDKLVTSFGVWMRENLPVQAIHALTWSTIATECLAFTLIITPVFVRQARLLAVCILPLLHFSFAMGLNLGGFTPAMMSFYPLLLGPSHWRWLERRFGARLAPTVAAFERRVRPRLGPRRRAKRPPATWYQSVREGAMLLLMFVITAEVLNSNAAVPMGLRVREPQWAKAVIEYPRILQGWSMFSPEPSRVDSMIYVDAVTANGNHVDPYNEVASEQPYPAGDIVPTHMGQSQFFVMYSERIPYDGFANYRQAFSEWLVAYPERTGRPRDCLLSYNVYLVTDRSPEPGSRAKPTPLERRLFMSYVAPPDSLCRR